MWKHGNALFHQKSMYWQCCVCRCIVVMKFEISDHLQFAFELIQPLSQMAQNFKIIFLIQCEIKWYKFFMYYPARIQEKNDHCLDFLFAHDSFLLSWRLSHLSFLILHLGFRVVLKKTNFVTCYDPIKKSCSALSRWSISVDTSLQCAFWLSFKFFGTISAHILSRSNLV
jgi:hypothetical protein